MSGFIPEADAARLTGPPPPKPSVAEAKANLLAEEPDFSPAAAATGWARKHGITLSVISGVAGLVLYRSRTVRRIAMAALLAPAVRREVMRRATELLGAFMARR